MDTDTLRAKMARLRSLGSSIDPASPEVSLPKPLGPVVYQPADKRLPVKRVTISLQLASTSRDDTIKKAISQYLIEWPVKATITGIAVEPWVMPQKSRADRLSAALSSIDDALSEIDELKGELESWRDNLPENFQDKASELDEAVGALESGRDTIEDGKSELENVEFPGAFGR